MHVLISNGTVLKYPYSIKELKKDNPNTSFPATISDEVLSEFNVQKVFFSYPADVVGCAPCDCGRPRSISGIC